ncbi:MAG: hypothetical protein IPK52_07875 [Chloroflexi bacterium]|nr:hypothetical protein [Chloroflexota bacterium]
MAGNREAYEKYMTSGHDAAWDQNWPVAIRAYTLAVQEMVEDAEAHLHLGLAFLKADKLNDALRTLERAQQLAPEDPAAAEQAAEVLERMGRNKEASQKYAQVAESYLGLRDIDKSIFSWERATALTPGLTSVHAKLAQAYERINDRKRSLRQYLILAYWFQRNHDSERAAKAVERALKLDPRNSFALNSLNALRSGGELVMPPDDENSPGTLKHSEKRLDSDFDFEDAESARRLEGDPRGPLGEAINQALNLLAAYVLETGMLDETGADALQAMELQRQDARTEAIAAYQRAVVRLQHPALKMSLGGLLLQADRAEESLKHLEVALNLPELSTGALHALGMASAKLGRQKQAARYLVQALHAIDTKRNGATESETKGVYEGLLNALNEANDELLSAINQRLLRTLAGKEWPQRVGELRVHLDEMLRTAGAGGVRDFLGSGGGDELADTVSRIDRYIREGRLLLAMDEAHQAVEDAPYYLPVHVRMAEIMVREGRLRQAINKYYTVAQSYIVRNDFDRAVSILNEVLEMAPLDTNIRSTLINILETQGRNADALAHYIQLGKNYKQLGNIEGAREALVMAHQLAKRFSTDLDQQVSIKHQIADIDITRLDVRRAQRTYEEILQIAPTDERAQRQLIDILFSQTNSTEAIKRLDALLGMYAKNRQVTPILKTLEELSKHYPEEIGLRSRLAGIYRQMNRTADAIVQLDALGELQMKAGMTHEAAITIKQLLRLGPQNSEQYVQLLRQIEP